MMTLPFFTPELVQRLGWTLVQFLWQGTLVAVVYALARTLIGRQMPPRVRYVLACGTLAVMAVTPALTFLLAPRLAAGAPASAWPLPTADAWQPVMPWLVAGWLAGVTAFTLRLLGGLHVTARLRSVGVRAAPPESQQLFDDVRQRLRVSRPVQLLVSARVEVPTVVGWLRPVVLVPVGALTGLPTAHVTALLAHELAHVRRHDYAVNVLQRSIEALLFYHPAIWWVSDQIRLEREMCCDDLAVAAQGDALTYARALAELEVCRSGARRATVSADGPSLLRRIRRLLGQPPALSHTLPGPGAAVTMTVLWAIGLGAVAAHSAASTPEPVAARVHVAPPSLAPAVSARSAIVSAVILGPIGPAPVPEPRATAAQAPGTVTQPALPSSTLRPPQTGTGVIRGRVLERGSGRPVRKARVLLSAAGVAHLPTALTDDSGAYVLTGLPPARFTVVAAKGGYVTLEYGQDRPEDPGRPVEMAQGQTTEGIDFALPPGGVISGRVVDETGEPMASALVQALRPRSVQGVREALESVGERDVTDDRGQFRLFGLPEGQVLLSAFAPDPRFPTSRQAAVMPTVPMGIMPTFYPGTLTAAQAQPISVSAGTQTSGLVLPIVRPRPSAISGVVQTSDASPPSQVRLMVGQLSPQGFTARGGNAMAVQEDGTFSIRDLPPGVYTVTARSAANRDLIATVNTTLEGTGAVLALNLRPGSTLRGRIIFESDAARESLRPDAIRMLLEGIDAIPGGLGGDRVAIADDWSIHASTLAGRYWVRFVLPDGWALESVRHNGTDITDAPLTFESGDLTGVDVRLTQNPTTVLGSVSSEPGEGVAVATIVVFADDPGRWGPRTRFVRAARLDQNGRFTIRALPPASYVAVAVRNLPAGAESDPELLARLRPSGTRLTLKDGETRELSLRLSTVP